MFKQSSKNNEVAIIGAGWYGCHIAITLGNKGYSVTLIDGNSDICYGISGKFGIRAHAGPHYPRSDITRKGCQTDLFAFMQEYPSIINNHKYSIYGLGYRDAKNLPSKVDLKQFQKVCMECDGAKEIDVKKYGYAQDELQTVFDIPEPTIKLGAPLREELKSRLKQSSVKVMCNTYVSHIYTEPSKIRIQYNNEKYLDVDYIVNATSYKALLPRDPLPFEVVYQPCLALMYEDKQGTYASLPIGLIIMDGFYPCLMPYDDEATNVNDKTHRKYILTHGNWTIMGSYKNLEKAESVLSELKDEFIEKKIKPPCEQEMSRFWPKFNSRFKYMKWVGSVLAKPKTDKEFRSALTFRHSKTRQIYVFPGKVTNVCQAATEVEQLINNQLEIEKTGKYEYIKDGVLSNGMQEVTEKPRDKELSTCCLDTYQELSTKSIQEKLLISRDKKDRIQIVSHSTTFKPNQIDKNTVKHNMEENKISYKKSLLSCPTSCVIL